MGNTQSDAQRKYSDYFISGDRIGSGTFATVKRCTRKEDKKEFAVKIIDKRHLTGRELVGLKDEIRILKAMEHPNVIKMCDVFDDSRRVKMVLELCEGGDLFDQILKAPNRRFEEKKAARITAIIGRALQYLHSNFVVHRDLKPENILFTKSGTLKVTDFGLAHYLKLPPEFHVMHTCCGTPHYVAPEVLGNSEYSIHVDFWSLGVILYIMLSGYQPFNSHSIHAMYGMIIRGQYRFPSPHWDHVTDIAKDCVRGLMCVDPKKRLDCDAMLKHEFIRKNVDLDELIQQETQLLAHQKELIKHSLDHLDVDAPKHSHNHHTNEKDEEKKSDSKPIEDNTIHDQSTLSKGKSSEQKISTNIRKMSNSFDDDSD